MAGPPVPYIEFRDVSKSYRRGEVVLDALNLRIHEGEFFTLLGPSGSGKSTALMLLAGFEAPTHGDIRAHGESLLRRPPHERNFGMVFQDHALFPHLDVTENVAYPLRMRKRPAQEIRRRVHEMLETVKLEDCARRSPHSLSQDQRQRVALARALVFEPGLVLLDEPLSSLDRRLRDELRDELRIIHERLGNTFVYVTHDQSEAMALSDRVALIQAGQLRQIGSPRELYSKPRTSFVARFIGECNMLLGTVRSVEGARCEVVLDTGERVLATAVNIAGPGSRTSLAVRPESLVFDAPGAEFENRFACQVREVVWMGDHLRVRTSFGGNEHFIVRLDQRRHAQVPPPHQDVELCWRADDCRALDAATGGA